MDIERAERFLSETARLLDRHRAAVLLHGAPPEPALRALLAYRNDDGGFGHALEPDVRDPGSQPAATVHALEVLSEIGVLDPPMVAGAAAWAAGVAHPDGSLPFVLPTAADSPHAPWMGPDDGPSFLTFGAVAAFSRAGVDSAWVQAATDWCWGRVEDPASLGSYWVKFALVFLDAVPDATRARAALDGLRPLIEDDGTIPVAGGQEEERLMPLDLSPHPGSRSRALFSDDQIARGLDELAAGQQDDGGWTFDWLDWCAGQRVEWRGGVTLRALATLIAHGRAGSV